MPDLPRQIRLAAGDYFMHGQDRRMRRAGMLGNVCRVALRLEAGLDVNLLRERVTVSPILTGSRECASHARCWGFPRSGGKRSSRELFFSSPLFRRPAGMDPGCCPRW